MHIEIKLSDADKKELKESITASLIDELRAFNLEQLHTVVYTVTQVAEIVHFHPSTVRQFIRVGQKARNGKVVRLKAREITTGHFRILKEDLDAFLLSF